MKNNSLSWNLYIIYKEWILLLRSGPIVWVLDPDPSFLKNSDPAKMPQKEHTTAYFAYEILYFLQATIRNSFINLIY